MAALPWTAIHFAAAGAAISEMTVADVEVCLCGLLLSQSQWLTKSFSQTTYMLRSILLML